MREVLFLISFVDKGIRPGEVNWFAQDHTPVVGSGQADSKVHIFPMHIDEPRSSLFLTRSQVHHQTYEVPHILLLPNLSGALLRQCPNIL